MAGDAAPHNAPPREVKLFPHWIKSAFSLLFQMRRGVTSRTMMRLLTFF
jgi:hypothetical protein